MKVYIIASIFFSYFLPTYTMDQSRGAQALAVVPSLFDLCTKKMWREQLGFKFRADGYIEWGEVHSAFYKDILKNCQTTPDTLMMLLKNSEAVEEHGYVESLLYEASNIDSVSLVRALEHEPLPFKEGDKRRLLLTDLLKKKKVDALPEVVIAYEEQQEGVVDFARALINVPRGVAQDRHEGLVLEGRDDFKVRLSNLDNDAVNHYDLAGHKGLITKVKFNKDATMAASGDTAGEVWCWDIAQRKGKKIVQHVGPVCGIKFCDSLLVSHGVDKTVRLSHLLTGVAVKMRGKKQQIRDVDVSSERSELSIHAGGRAILLPYPARYLAGELTAEQLIIAYAIKDLEVTKAKKRDAESLRRVLRKRNFCFEPGAQAYFEKFSDLLELEEDEPEPELKED